MKKNLYFLLIAFLPLQLFAQPVIHNMENNPMGMSAKFLQCSTTGISVGLSGAGQTWTMSGLVAAGTANDTFYETTIANYGSVAPSATRIDSFTSTSLFSAKYYINQTTGNTYMLNDSITGSADVDYTLPLTGITVAKQPIHYLDTYTDTFNYTYYSSTPMISYNGYYIVNVDGYGTLTLPNATYNNVLRVHVNEIDTSHATGGPYLSTRNTYAWYDDIHSALLCKIRYDTFTTGHSVAAYYLLSQAPLVSVSTVNNKATDFTACFSGNSLILKGEFELGDSYALSVFNIAGQKVYSNSFITSGNNATFNMDRWLGPGIYSVALFNNNTHNFNSIKVLKQ